MTKASSLSLILFYIFISLASSSTSGRDHCQTKNEEDGQCQECKPGYYLDKSDENKCKNSFNTPIFHSCKETIDGVTCETCLDGYYFSSNKECVNTKNCLLSKKKISYCEKCNEGYYLQTNGNYCVKTENCLEGDMSTGNCKICDENFYLDTESYKCKSNQGENDKFKNCFKGGDYCEECVFPYFLGEDKKCSNSQNCLESENGECIKCLDDFYFTSEDKKCTATKNCTNTNFEGECNQCIGNYYYDIPSKTCKEITDDNKEIFFKCKKSDEDGQKCAECVENCYLDKNKSRCFGNLHGEFENKFYKCKYTNDEGDLCLQCVDEYYLGALDNKCSKIYGCAKSKSIACLDCGDSFYLNKKDKLCYENDKYENGRNIFYKCKETNKEGNLCEVCQGGYLLNEDGYCVDTLNCEERAFGGQCIKCLSSYENEDDDEKYYYCLNSFNQCAKTKIKNCLLCDEEDEGKCIECYEGYRYDKEENLCVKCKEGCSFCSNDEDCGGCLSKGYFTVEYSTGFLKFDALCQKCKEGCSYCSGDDNCRECDKGYFVSKGIEEEENVECSKCSEGCEECTSESHCVICEDGYQIETSGRDVFCKRIK